VVVVQLLPADAAEAVHEATGTLLVLFVEQLVVVHWFPAAAVIGVQLCTGVGPVVATLQVVAVQLFPAVADTGVHVCTPVFVTLAAQVVAVQLLPDDAAIGVQVWTGVGPVVTVGQVIVVHASAAVAVAGVHDCTGTLLVLFVLQVVAV